VIVTREGEIIVVTDCLEDPEFKCGMHPGIFMSDDMLERFIQIVEPLEEFTPEIMRKCVRQALEDTTPGAGVTENDDLFWQVEEITHPDGSVEKKIMKHTEEPNDSYNDE